jgi:hypothetical protein
MTDLDTTEPPVDLVTSWLDFAPARERDLADGVKEAIEAGFTRDPFDPCFAARAQGRAGFEAGGPADGLVPCSVLAELTGQSRDRMAGLTDDELVGLLRAARRVQSWQAALELEAVNELAARRRAEPARPGPRVSDRIAAELGAALTLTTRSADSLAELAESVERLDGVREALADGRIDLARARVFAQELAPLETLTANVIATRVLLAAPGLTTVQLRARLRRAVLAADPKAGRRRQEKARDQARVEAWEESSGNGGLAGRELPPAAALTADRHLSALARSLKAAGAVGTMDQLRATLYLALLSGQDPAAVLCRPGTADRPETWDSPDVTTPDAAGRPDSSSRDQDTESLARPDLADKRDRAADARDRARDGAAARAAGLGLRWPSGPLGTIHLVMPLSAWLEQTDNPGEVAGHGPVDAWTSRQLAGQLAGLAGTRYCLTVTSNSGQAIAHACARRPPPRPGGPRSSSPPGQSPRAVDPDELRHWLRGLSIECLTRHGACDHASQSPGYRPPTRLAHLVKVASPTCTAPGCRRPAEACDLDHVTPYDQGGRTCYCNLHPACRRHHQLKQQPGWHADKLAGASMMWTLPHGRAYATTPEPYPL